jgi:hypothetical protein
MKPRIEEAVSEKEKLRGFVEDVTYYVSQESLRE